MGLVHANSDIDETMDVAAGAGAPVAVLWTVTDWARAILELPADREKPARTAIVPNAQVARGLRRELRRLERPDGIAGTRFVTLADAAGEVLRAAGSARAAGEEALREAARLLQAAAGRWPFPGPALAVVVGDAGAAEAALVRAIPGARLGVLAGRPARRGYLERAKALFGAPVAEALRAARYRRAGGRELDVLASYLFEDARELARKDRPRSAGADGSVALEQHDGADAEIQAAAAWVARLVAEHGAAPEEVALIVPALEPWAALLAARLAEVSGGEARIHPAGRAPGERAGERGVFVGTPAHADGLRFRAVRVLGLWDGSFFDFGHVGPDEDPARPGGAPGPPDRGLAVLHALDRLVRNAEAEVALSAARFDLDGCERAPDGIFLEAVAALGRGAEGGFPDAGALASGVLASGVLARDAPPSAAAWLDRAASPEGRARGLPARWFAAPELDLARAGAALVQGAPAGLDGAFEAPVAGLGLPGLGPERPITAEALRVLLVCPQRFLLAEGLGFHPREAPSPHRLEHDAYGRLLRGALAAFYRPHGAAFGRRERTLAAWEEVADAIAGACFGASRDAAALRGEGVRAQQRVRLGRDVRLFLASDWCGGRPRHFVAAEEPYGARIDAGGAPLYVTGTFGRLDVDGDRLLVREVRLGRCKPRHAEPARPDRDLPLAVAGIAARALSRRLGLGGRIGAATVHAGLQTAERSFEGDFDGLEAACRAWLALAGRMLRAQRFPHAPSEEACRGCPFRPVCGEAGPARARALAAAGDEVVRALAAAGGA